MQHHIVAALMTIKDFTNWSRIGRTKTYEEIGCSAGHRDQ